jgi:hypothetical protein
MARARVSASSAHRKSVRARVSAARRGGGSSRSNRVVKPRGIVAGARSGYAAVQKVRSLPVTRAEAKIRKYEAQIKLIDVKKRAGVAKQTAAAIRQQTRVAKYHAGQRKKGSDLGGFEVRTVRPGGPKVVAKASEDPRFPNHPKAPVRPTAARPAPAKPTKPTKPSTPPAPPASPVSTRRRSIVSGSASPVRVAVVLEADRIADMTAVGGVEVMIPVLRQVGVALGAAFDSDMADYMNSLMGPNARGMTAGLVPSGDLKAFQNLLASAGSDLRAAFTDLAKAVARENDMVAKALASEYDKKTLDAAAQLAK